MYAARADAAPDLMMYKLAQFTLDGSDIYDLDGKCLFKGLKDFGDLAMRKPDSKNAVDCKLSWALNKLCNYRCSYCFHDHGYLSREHPDCGTHNPNEISRRLDETGKRWHIHMSGGEPFLYPSFVDLCSALTRNHFISINTNLSTSNVDSFINEIDPTRVRAVSASLHIHERQKKANGYQKFIDRCLMLQDKRFHIRVDYLVYPPLLPVIESDIEHLKNQGINLIHLKMFRGWYKRKYFPNAYSIEARNFIAKHSENKQELDILNGSIRPFGETCAAGVHFFKMDIQGNIRRCATAQRSYGNLFDGTMRIDSKARACPYAKCRCPYEGLDYLTGRKAPVSSITAEIVREYPKFLSNNIGKIRKTRKVKQLLRTFFSAGQ